MFLYIYIYTCSYVYIYINTYIHTCSYIYIYICSCVYIYTHMFIYWLNSGSYIRSQSIYSGFSRSSLPRPSARHVTWRPTSTPRPLVHWAAPGDSPRPQDRALGAGGFNRGDDDIPNIYGKIKNGNQTTNQQRDRFCMIFWEK